MIEIVRYSMGGPRLNRAHPTGICGPDRKAPAIETASLLILCLAALGTSVVSAVLGMAGGIMLLAIMLLFLEPSLAIPIHGLVQLASNSSRTVIHAKDIRRDLLLPYSLLVLPAGFLTVPLVQHAPAEALKLLIGVFVLVATWRPRWLLLGFDPARVPVRPRFALLGGVSGALGPIIGATGPFIAPFFLGIGLTRFELIGTKAACQAVVHLAKIILFGLAGFAFREYAFLCIGMTASVVIGTNLGTRLLRKLSDDRFTQLYKTALTLVALRLIWIGLPLMGSF